jgi:hypothetical protein
MSKAGCGICHAAAGSVASGLAARNFRKRRRSLCFGEDIVLRKTSGGQLYQFREKTDSGTSFTGTSFAVTQTIQTLNALFIVL